MSDCEGAGQRVGESFWEKGTANAARGPSGSIYRALCIQDCRVAPEHGISGWPLSSFPPAA
ncbi:hypothetical protein EMIT047CA2_40229 [Pseudomonas soli]